MVFESSWAWARLRLRPCRFNEGKVVHPGDSGHRMVDTVSPEHELLTSVQRSNRKTAITAMPTAYMHRVFQS